jgi:tagatose 1,6-diphosphate aldolase
MAGRAVWKEAVTCDQEARRRFINQTGRERILRLRALCDALARPFADVYDRPEIQPDWYKKY